MDKAAPWQKQVVKLFEKYNILILNPRRDGWDSSWKQSIDDKNFNGQVTWELDGQDTADAIIIYFDPETKSPISLLELGLYGPQGKVHVICNEPFWRKGNVDIVCKRYGIPEYATIEDAVDGIVKTYSLVERTK